jgi:hypothetical protein
MKLFGPSVPQNPINRSRNQVQLAGDKASRDNLTTLQQDTVSFSNGPIKFAGGKVTSNDVKALEKAFPSILLGYQPEDLSVLAEGKFKLLNLSIERNRNHFALRVETMSEAGRTNVVNKLIRLSGAKKEPKLRAQYKVDAPNQIISLPFKQKGEREEKRIPIIVTHTPNSGFVVAW